MANPNDIANLDENKPDGAVIPVAQLDDYQREHRRYFKGWAVIEHSELGRHAFAVGATGARPTNPAPAVGTIFINTTTLTIEYWNGSMWVNAVQPSPDIPTGSVMLFRQNAAPTGWTRVVDAPRTDSVIRVLLNGESLTDGGSWTITGLSVALGTHDHEAPECLHQAFSGGEEHVDDNFFPLSGNNRDFFRVTVSSDVGTVSEPTVNTGPTDLGTPAVASTGAWRPLHVDVIAATKT